jgi:hypothetical protein
MSLSHRSGDQVDAGIPGIHKGEAVQPDAGGRGTQRRRISVAGPGILLWLAGRRRRIKPSLSCGRRGSGSPGRSESSAIPARAVLPLGLEERPLAHGRNDTSGLPLPFMSQRPGRAKPYVHARSSVRPLSSASAGNMETRPSEHVFHDTIAVKVRPPKNRAWNEGPNRSAPPDRFEVRPPSPAARLSAPQASIVSRAVLGAISSL